MLQLRLTLLVSLPNASSSQGGSPQRPGDSYLGSGLPPPPLLQLPSFPGPPLPWPFWFRLSESGFLALFLNLFLLLPSPPTLGSQICIFYTMPNTGYLCLWQNLVRMLWGLGVFPNESFLESKYYEEGQIISNYNLQKMRELSQQTEQGEANYRNICKKSNILFFKAIKSCKHTNKCILIRVKLLVNEFALGFCIFGVKIYKCFY